MISRLIDCADRLTDEEARTCRALAASNPDAVVDIVRERMGAGDYQETLRQLFAPCKDPSTQRTWTRAHELVARCNFAGVVTTNYDPGIANARMAVRTQASATGFASWDDEELMVRWRWGTVFDDDAFPVLYAHGHHNRSESIVLATTEYRRAYRGMLGEVLGRLLDTRSAVWIGFSFADKRIETILREIGDRSSTSLTTRPATRHVAIMSWDPAAGQDLGTIRSVMEIQFGCRVVLYPTPDGDHSALGALLAELTDPRYPAAALAPVEATPIRDGGTAAIQQWVHGGDRVAHFTGRAEELARLTRWARDPEVRLVGVTAWGGAGKTALVTEWLAGQHGAQQRPAIRGVFAWGFYQRNSAQEWAAELLSWVAQTFRVAPTPGPLAGQVLVVLRAVPLVLVLDGWRHSGGAGWWPVRASAGRHVARRAHRGLPAGARWAGDADQPVPVRRPGAVRRRRGPDDGRATVHPGRGSHRARRRWRRLAARDRTARPGASGGWACAGRRCAGRCAGRPAPAADLQVLRAELLAAGQTDTRVSKVLRFYADRLGEAECALAAVIGLFQRPVPVATVLALGSHDATGVRLVGWAPAQVETAVRQRLSGLLS